MPYIKSGDGRREALRKSDTALTAGELNYQIFYFIKHRMPAVSDNYNKSKIEEFVKRFLGEKPNYQRYNDMAGCLVLCTLEIKRRLNIDTDILLEIAESYMKEINIYEDEKIRSNGDVE